MKIRLFDVPPPVWKITANLSTKVRFILKLILRWRQNQEDFTNRW